MLLVIFLFLVFFFFIVLKKSRLYRNRLMLDIGSFERVQETVLTAENVGRSLVPSCAGCVFGLDRMRAGQDC